MATPGGGKGGGMAWLLGGIVVGILGTIILPRLAAPYLPEVMRGEQQEVSGIVEAKSAEVDRLLLTVGSEAGAMLVTYTKNVAEIDLLIDVGDSVLLVVDEYAPFINDARIRRVIKSDESDEAGPPEVISEPVMDLIAEPITEVEPATSDSSP
ncbi:MAG: hypothetical protein E2O48_00515 [Gemmatimonadetes bacterium]|nr:MAG: hypothetical protein E2O48_00515 [Gemmatimonadota bacterium]